MRRVYIKEENCIGCHLCEIYCQLRQANSKDLIKAFKRETPRPLPRLRIEENGAVSFSIRCLQCEEAPCVQACITGAITYNTVKAVVEIDTEKCIGCWTCLLFCPVSAIRQDIEKRKVLKCDLCEGEDEPLCIINCPNEALIYIDVKDANSVAEPSDYFDSKSVSVRENQ